MRFTLLTALWTMTWICAAAALVGQCSLRLPIHRADVGVVVITAQSGAHRVDLVGWSPLGLIPAYTLSRRVRSVAARSSVILRGARSRFGRTGLPPVQNA